MAVFAKREALDALLRPRSVAVVGAGRTGLGRLVLDHVLAAGFRGPVFAVHPEAETVAGVPAFPSPALLPEPPDLAVVAVRAEAAVEAVRELGRAGCRAAVVVSAGFAETGPGGAALEAELVRAARGSGMRLLGPNCMGLVNTHPRARLHAAFGVGPAPPGGLALVTQSGSIGDFVLYHAEAQGLGVSILASVGNEADLTAGELVRAAARDRRTRVLGCHLEEPAEPADLLRAIARASRRKPVVALLGGRSPVGRAVGASHAGREPGAWGGPAEPLLARAGAVVLSRLDELLPVAAALESWPGGAGRRVAVLTNAGGPAVLAADAAAAAGLLPVVLSAAARRAIRSLGPLPPVVGPVVDLTASATPASFGRAARALARAADSLLCVVMSPHGSDPTPVVEAVAAAARGPLVFCLLARGPAVERARLAARRAGAPVVAEPETGIRCLEALALRAETLARPRRSPGWPPGSLSSMR